MGKKKTLEDIIKPQTLNLILAYYERLKKSSNLQMQDWNYITEQFDKTLKLTLHTMGKLNQVISNALKGVINKGLINDEDLYSLEKFLEYTIKDIIQEELNRLESKAKTKLFHKKGNYFLTNTIEKYNYDPENKALMERIKGSFKDYARDFLLLALSLRLKKLTGKPSYGILLDYLQRKGLCSKECTEQNLTMMIRRAMEYYPFLKFIHDTYLHPPIKLI
jgi:hypothetical protein